MSKYCQVILHAGINGYVYDPKFRDDLSVPADLVAAMPYRNHF